MALGGVLTMCLKWPTNRKELQLSHDLLRKRET